MIFVPAIEWPGEASPRQWQLAFVDGQLLLPEPEGSTLTPLADAAWRHAAEAVHYLGRLDGADCWALRLPEAPAGWRRVPLPGLRPQRLPAHQPGEIEDAQWFDLDALPKIPPRFSISGHLIRDTVAALRAP